MIARKGTRLGKKLRWTLLRVIILIVLALFGLEHFGLYPLDMTRISDLKNRIAHADNFTELACIVKNEFRKKQGSVFPPDSSDLRALAQNTPLITLENLPEYEGRSFVVLNRNEPVFSEEFKARKDAFYSFTPLDALGRCGAAYGKLGPEFLPDQPRGPLGMIKPTGWRYTKYDDIDQKYLYNRCHLLAFQLTGENANALNLITGTRHFNVIGMLPFENRVGDYIRRTGKHVLYRVTPVFRGQELVARGVTMEALSADDGGKAVRFHVFVYNVQPGIEINYANGMNRRK
ncbi:MAG: DNA/RNA non-specific endonuclease [Acidaminococcaceae bacterium]|nr:DNA/RNA non-specific endonuclease [Acidaminococcaceae bacterium]